MKPDKFIEEKYGLKGNPFLDVVAREIWLNTWVNREEELKEWGKIISDAVSSTKNYIVFIIGSYGRGKTLSLLKIIDEAKKYDAILPNYLTFKEEQKPKNPGLDFIFRIFKSMDFEKLKVTRSETELEKAIEYLPSDLEEVKTVLRKIYLGESNEGKLALYFLKGEIKPTQSQLKKLEVIRKIEDVDIAKEYLAGVLGFIKSLGFSTLLLAVDEFEYLFSLVPKSQQNIYLALLRGLYDFSLGSRGVGDIANMALFIAISEDGRRNLNEMEKKEIYSGGPIHPLLDRIDSETVLTVFDKHQTRELIEKRLRFNRIEGKYEQEPLIPFTNDFIEFLYDKTNGEPRAIIARCSHVLDVGLEKGVALLDKIFAQKALEERGWI